MLALAALAAWLLLPALAQDAPADTGDITIITAPRFHQCDVTRIDWQGGSQPYAIYMDVQSTNSTPQAQWGDAIVSNWTKNYFKLFANCDEGQVIKIGIRGSESEDIQLVHRDEGGVVIWPSNAGECLDFRGQYPSDTIPVVRYIDNNWGDSPNRPKPGSTSWLDGPIVLVSRTAPIATMTATASVESTAAATHSGLSIGAIVGIAIGAVVVCLAILAGIIFFCCFRQRFKEWRVAREDRMAREELVAPYMLVAAQGGGVRPATEKERRPRTGKQRVKRTQWGRQDPGRAAF